MDPIIGGALIAGVSGLASGIMNSNSSAKANRDNINFQREVNQRNEYLANTAYVRASTDMKNAGLNPMMMFGSGSASSAGATTTAAQVASEQEGEMISRAGQSAQQALSAKMALDQNDADLLLKEKQARQAEESTKLTETTAKKTAEEIAKVRQEIANLRAGKAGIEAGTRKTDLETSNLAITQPRVAAEAEAGVSRANTEKDNVWWDKKMQQLGVILDNASSAGAFLTGRSFLRNHPPVQNHPDGSITTGGKSYAPIYKNSGKPKWK